MAVLRSFYLRLDRRFAEVRTDIDHRFVEVQAGFAEARDDRWRLEEKLDGYGKDLARLEGIVERTYEPHRFTVGIPGTPPGVPRVAPDAPEEPPADPRVVGST